MGPLLNLQISRTQLGRIADALERLAACAERAFPAPLVKKPGKIGVEALSQMTDAKAYDQEMKTWEGLYGPNKPKFGKQDARLGATEGE